VSELTFIPRGLDELDDVPGPTPGALLRRSADDSGAEWGTIESAVEA
jgi:hypothetical protein